MSTLRAKIEKRGDGWWTVTFSDLPLYPIARRTHAEAVRIADSVIRHAAYVRAPCGGGR